MASTLRISIAAVAAVAVGMAGIWTAMDRPDALIERSFAGAFDRLESAPPPRTETPLFDPAQLHLSRLEASSPMSSPLALGDRMTIAGRAGSLATYEVIELRPLRQGTGSGASHADERMLLVTAVSVGQAPAQTIRFVVEASSTTDRISPPARPHAL